MTVLFSARTLMLVYRVVEGEMRQESFGVQGIGPGSDSGPGPLAAMDICVRGARDGGAEKDAEMRPAKATNKAKMRMAAFIFGNLMN